MIFENFDEEFFDNTDAIELTKEQYDMLRSVYDKSMEQLSKMSLEERIFPLYRFSSIVMVSPQAQQIPILGH